MDAVCQPANESAPKPAKAATFPATKLRLPVWLLALLLALATTALYWPALRCGFVNYDDPAYVTGNLQVQKGLTVGSVKWAFSSAVASNWHPVTLLSHMLDWQMYG